MKNLLPFIILFLSFVTAYADGTTQYSFQQIDLNKLNNLNNGLSLNVSCMTVSHDKGYVWIGTRTGIGRFDGYELKNICREPSLPTSQKTRKIPFGPLPGKDCSITTTRPTVSFKPLPRTNRHL